MKILIESMDCISRVGVLVYFLLYVKVGYNGLYVMIEDVGKVNSLPEVIKKLILPDDNRYYVKDFPVAQPNHGYAVAFKTENDEVKYLRILITDYTLDHNGTVAALTVQYQLY